MGDEAGIHRVVADAADPGLLVLRLLVEVLHPLAVQAGLGKALRQLGQHGVHAGLALQGALQDVHLHLRHALGLRPGDVHGIQPAGRSSDHAQGILHDRLPQPEPIDQLLEFLLLLSDLPRQITELLLVFGAVPRVRGGLEQADAALGTQQVVIEVVLQLVLVDLVELMGIIVGSVHGPCLRVLEPQGKGGRAWEVLPA
ncbi:hypothetical protein ACFFX0_10290 [Citricoccus parietis]|uniref:Uncharacterized protein n=1 Tax=Citricoccus parietis TaxID=592307 RepID=A0ABV5FY27_9MICC